MSNGHLKSLRRGVATHSSLIKNVVLRMVDNQSTTAHILLAWGLLQKKVRIETYLPVGTFPRGWYVYMIFHDIYTDFYTVSEVG